MQPIIEAMKRLPLVLFLALALFLAFAPVPGAFAQSAANVLVVVNEASADSVAIADHYARARGVPAE
jgi:putative cell wall-binding protein